MQLTRREFLLLSGSVLFWSCGGVESNDQLPAPDFYLIGNQSKIAETAHDISKSFLANPHRRYRVGISENENLVFELVNSRGLANYPYLRVSHERLENGKLHIEPINFLWGLDSTEGLSIVMKDDSGKEIKREKIQSSTRSVEDWIKLGAKAVALGFIFWLGAGIVKFLAAAIGFIAFNIMVIGLLLAAGAIAVAILNKLGIDWQQLKSFVEKGIQFFEDFLRQIFNSL